MQFERMVGEEDFHKELPFKLILNDEGGQRGEREEEEQSRQMDRLCEAQNVKTNRKKLCIPENDRRLVWLKHHEETMARSSRTEWIMVKSLNFTEGAIGCYGSKGMV